MSRITCFFICLLVVFTSYGQSAENAEVNPNDTVSSKPIIFSATSASEYIINLLGSDGLWRTTGDTMQVSLSRLLHHYHEPFDSVATRLSRFDYNIINPRRTSISHKDTLPLRWLSESVFFIDTVKLGKEPFYTQKTVIIKAVDSMVFSLTDRIPDMKFLVDSMLQLRDTITEVLIDTQLLESKNVRLHQLVDDQIVPPLFPTNTGKSIRFLADSSRIVVTETSRAYVADRESPFYIVPGEMMPDSLRFAVETLLRFSEERDSILLFFTDLQGRSMPFWISSQKEEMRRYWVKNYENDSITIWIGNPAKNNITLILEDDVQVERMEKKLADDIPITTSVPQRTLASVRPLKEIPVHWKLGLSSAFILNQTYLSNWARGGENSLSSMLDLRGTALYTNAEAKKKWESSGRLRYGTVVTQEHGFRTNTDLLEFNSQYNKVIREKIDFSSVFYMKTQVDKGFKYPNDSVVVSKFLNPGTFTIGVGFEYKPFKNTSLNFSALSYKNTFVLDTANINQKTHGIDIDKRSRQEMGGQLMIRNTVTILDGLKISNAIRLFSGYLDKPQNIDVDWEINLDKQINWYFLVRVNLHFIYDDDIRFAVLDQNDQPVLLPDGSEKRVPKLQFKQFLGLTLSFRI
jgi:hypothetical protein